MDHNVRYLYIQMLKFNREVSETPPDHIKKMRPMSNWINTRTYYAIIHIGDRDYFTYDGIENIAREGIAHVYLCVLKYDYGVRLCNTAHNSNIMLSADCFLYINLRVENEL